MMSYLTTLVNVLSAFLQRLARAKLTERICLPYSQGFEGSAHKVLRTVTETLILTHASSGRSLGAGRLQF